MSEAGASKLVIQRSLRKGRSVLWVYMGRCRAGPVGSGVTVLQNCGIEWLEIFPVPF